MHAPSDTLGDRQGCGKLDQTLDVNEACCDDGVGELDVLLPVRDQLRKHEVVRIEAHRLALPDVAVVERDETVAPSVWKCRRLQRDALAVDTSRLLVPGGCDDLEAGRFVEQSGEWVVLAELASSDAV